LKIALAAGSFIDMTSISFDPISSEAPLVVYIDYKSPYAFLAKDPTYAIEDELGAEIDWRPFTLDIPSFLGSARLDRQGKVAENRRTADQWTWVKYAYRDARRYGSLRGLCVRGTTKIWDSSLAAIGMLWAKEQGKAVLRTYSGLVYERFWKRELDIEDPAVIEAVLSEAGARIAGFRTYLTGEGRVLHDRIQQAAFDAGVFGVPTYAVDGELFFGREHLPRIRWLLTGRCSAPPDIAYESSLPAGITADSTPRGTLTVAIDFKSPQAYLAIGPTRTLAEELGIAIDLQPFLVPPRKMPPPPSSGDDRGTRHRRFRAEYLERDVMRYATDRGLTISGLHRQTDSTLAALGLLWVKRECPSLAWDYVERVFAGHWCETLNIEDERAIRALLVAINAPVSGFESFVTGQGSTDLEKVQSELREAGVFDVPTYRLNGDVFVGRQHLPLIRCLLSGGTGGPRA
jgi:2-hydroxychromene-2-carboxylate isomerase